MTPLVLAVAVVVVLVGLAGVVIPVLPGLVLVWLATAGTVLLQGADATGWSIAAVLTLLLVAGTAATWWLPARTGLRGGAAPRSFLLAGVGAVVGFVVVPVVGFLLGALAGLAVGEWSRQGSWDAALATTRQVLRAYGIGVLVELGAGLTMVAVWVVALLTRR